MMGCVCLIMIVIEVINNNDNSSTGATECLLTERITAVLIIIIVEVLGLNSEAASIISEYSSTLPKRQHIKGF